MTNSTRNLEQRIKMKLWWKMCILTLAASAWLNSSRSLKVVAVHSKTSRYILSFVILHLTLQTECPFSDEDLLNILHDAIKAKDVVKCGWSEVRYVHISFSNEWIVRIEDIIVQPRMWTKIHGEPNTLIKRACMESVMSLVALNPGITEWRLAQQTGTFLNSVELSDLLQELCDLNALDYKIVFGDVSISKRTHYTVTLDWYRKTRSASH